MGTEIITNQNINDKREKIQNGENGSIQKLGECKINVILTRINVCKVNSGAEERT